MFSLKKEGPAVPFVQNYVTPLDFREDDADLTHFFDALAAKYFTLLDPMLESFDCAHDADINYKISGGSWKLIIVTRMFGWLWFLM